LARKKKTSRILMLLLSSKPYYQQTHHPLDMITRVLLVWVIIGTLATPYIAKSSTLPSIHHTLAVELDPKTHRLTATDTIHLPKSQFNHTPLSFALNPDLVIDRVELDGQAVSVLKTPHDPSRLPASTQWVIEHPESGMGQTEPFPTLTIMYHGPIDDSPTASSGLRFVRPDKTSGHIGPQGIYLSSETFWYPTWEQHLMTCELTLTLPSDWHSITQGQETSQSIKEKQRISHWRISSPTEALTLAANKFVVQKQPWRDIQVATYLFPDEAHLAQQYLDATETYLDLYTKLLGPYPFTQFAVVENFFPSGLGMPSFTLLGQGIVRRGYTQPYSLGHEIVHSWLGNSVFNDFAKGNWVEGLTTYLTNYYYDEATDNDAAAIKTRRRMMDEYNLYAVPGKDYPIHQFHHKETRIDNAVGYQKTALVFHMLRQELGDIIFFKGIRHIILEGTGQYVEWEDLKRIFSHVAKQDLTDFFNQWVDRPGAPSITLHNLSVQSDPLRSDQRIVSGAIAQQDTPYQLSLPIQVNLQDGSTFATTLQLNQASQSFTWNVPGIPTTITLDPEHHWLLRLQRDQLSPMLNGWDTDTRRIVVHGKTASKEEETSLRAFMQRIQGQPDIDIRQHDFPSLTEPASYLIIGTPARQLLESKTLQSCNRNVQMASGRVTIFDQDFEGPGMAFLITCPHPDSSNHTVSLFWGLSPEALMPVARLLFFYGWDSYLVFEQGKVVARGMFQPVHSAREFTIPAL
jgi:aminopeptidase N